MRRVIAVCVVAVMLSSCAQKAEVENLADGSCSSAQAKLVDKHISGQIDALASKNWQLAFSFASESFQENIGLDQFTEIISSQYSMLIENQGYKFEMCVFADDKVTQEVRVTSGGQDYLLTYRVSINGSNLGIEGAVVGMVDTPVTV
jgi:hypothetical protein|uniref:DUF4864 domain-containing protein n=1 Tax=Candidatus Planktophila sp. TaxID=2175601 RepID=UPI004049AD04